jgi:hypothetical protein
MTHEFRRQQLDSDKDAQQLCDSLKQFITCWSVAPAARLAKS